MKNILLSLFSLLFLSALVHGQNPYRYQQPKELMDGWKTADLRDLQLDTSKVYKLLSFLDEGENNLHSILLIKDEHILIEEYLNGHSPDQPHDLRSTTKSIRSLLVGIAIDKGFIESVDDPISKYLHPLVAKKNQDERKEKITIRHLLTMSSGLDCNDWDKKSKGQEDKVYRKKDWLQHTLDLPMVNEPGEVANYCSMGTVLLAEIVSRASNMTIDSFAQTYLFNPVGIERVDWDHTSSKEVIPSAKRLYMTPRDMAKIGQLVLNKGKWNNQQIVSEKWITESTSPQVSITGIDYGYLWWKLPFKFNDTVLVATAATGNGGQYILIFPELNMVAVFTGGAYNSAEDKLPFAIMSRVFLPLFEGEK